MKAPRRSADRTPPPELVDAPESPGRAVALDDRPPDTNLERQIGTLAKLLPLLRAIRNAAATPQDHK